MGHIKTFSEFINEAVSPVKKNADNIYKALHKWERGYFVNPMKKESSYLTSVVNEFGVEYNGEIYAIGINDGCELNAYRKNIFYQVFVADNAPIDPENGVNSSLWIEYGEESPRYDQYGHFVKPLVDKPWCLYYISETDTWVSVGGPIKIDNIPENDFGTKWILSLTTPVVNPKTKYTTEYLFSEAPVEEKETYLFTIDLDVMTGFYYDRGTSFDDIRSEEGQNEVLEGFDSVVNKVKAEIPELESKGIKVEYNGAMNELLIYVDENTIFYVTEKMMTEWLSDICDPEDMFETEIEDMIQDDENFGANDELYKKWVNYIKKLIGE